ncbi:MAG TPA: DUF4440 domain-containing protein [Casimicrobiaceae bacterium]
MNADSSLCACILDLELRLLCRNVRRSLAELEQLLADDFLEFGSSGAIYRKSDVIDALRREPIDARSLTDFRLVALARDVVLATYREARQPVDGTRPAHSLRSSVWRHNLGQWQLFFHQGTPCALAA